jgi:hypothetical protein
MVLIIQDEIYYCKVYSYGVSKFTVVKLVLGEIIGRIIYVCSLVHE